MDAAVWVPMAVNVLLGLIAFFGGLWIKHLQDALKGHEADVAALRERVADGCVRRDDYLLMRTETLDRLKAIEAKLDRLIEGGKA
ncbi:conserved hypothetical protein [Solidesulfovibrio fructosivorans JJ]]|uniref:Uncharacterized protein n=1 Tax=Solidesulfovibrio fructosivorans JJ] TaxID=596151 RepID=E1JU91_SOLFR|nr:hypothetical protein [Solidesulfovibrio fructosivorans]EFL52021.1 conserved hypothetical protein [Solidesulfovibrio fructosivorans JJ]]